MPLYEYDCPACKRVLEVMQKFSDPALKECPDCQGPITKLVSLSSFALKGSGWYTTDYKKSGAPAATPSSTATAAPTAPAPSTPAPTAPAPSTSKKGD